MSSKYKKPTYTKTQSDEKYIKKTDSTIVSTVTSTGQFMTTTVNGSAVAIPIYIY